MHVALAIMMVMYIVPMVYLVYLARLEVKRTNDENKTPSERSE